MHYDVIDYAEAFDTKADMREDAYREARHDSQLDDIQITWVRRRATVDIPVTIADFTKRIADAEDHPF